MLRSDRDFILPLFFSPTFYFFNLAFKIWRRPSSSPFIWIKFQSCFNYILSRRAAVWKRNDHKVARGTKYLLPPLTTPSFASRRQQRKVAFVSKMSSPPFAFETIAFLLLRVTLPFPSEFKSYQMTAAASFYQRINSIKFCKKWSAQACKGFTTGFA